MIEANPPGKPDDYSMLALTRYMAPDIEAQAKLAELRGEAFLLIAGVWAMGVAGGLAFCILSGSVFVYFAAFVLTVPYIVFCYKARTALERSTALNEWCNLEEHRTDLLC